MPFAVIMLYKLFYLHFFQFLEYQEVKCSSKLVVSLGPDNLIIWGKNEEVMSFMHFVHVLTQIYIKLVKRKCLFFY